MNLQHRIESCAESLRRGTLQLASQICINCASNFRTRHLHITIADMSKAGTRERWNPMGFRPEIPLILQTSDLAPQNSVTPPNAFQVLVSL